MLGRYLELRVLRQDSHVIPCFCLCVGRTCAEDMFLLSWSPDRALSFRHVIVRTSPNHKYIFTLRTHPSVVPGSIAFSLPQVTTNSVFPCSLDVSAESIHVEQALPQNCADSLETNQMLCKEVKDTFFFEKVFYFIHFVLGEAHKPQWRSESNWQGPLYHVGPGSQVHVIRFDGKHQNLLNHPSGLTVLIVNYLQQYLCIVLIFILI